MANRPSRTPALLLVALILAAACMGQPQESETSPFAPGETLTFDVSWSIFPAGQVVSTLRKSGGGPKDPYEVQTTARSQGFVSLLYNVRDDFTSLFDSHTLCSHRISKKINEGRHHKETLILYDYVRQLAILDERDISKPNAPPKRNENEIPPCVHNVVTAFYVARRQPLQVGKQFRLPVNDGAKTYEVTVEVQARERIQTPLGSREAFRLEPKVFGGLYKKKGRMLVWFSDDEQRLPLRIKAMLSMGTITANLKTVATQQPDESPPKP